MPIAIKKGSSGEKKYTVEKPDKVHTLATCGTESHLISNDDFSKLYELVEETSTNPIKE